MDAQRMPFRCLAALEASPWQAAERPVLNKFMVIMSQGGSTLVRASADYGGLPWVAMRNPFGVFEYEI